MQENISSRYQNKFNIGDIVLQHNKGAVELYLVRKILKNEHYQVWQFIVCNFTFFSSVLTVVQKQEDTHYVADTTTRHIMPNNLARIIGDYDAREKTLVITQAEVSRIQLLGIYQHERPKI